MLLLTIDRGDPLPLALQIRDRLAAMVEAGVLRAGERLPPTRTLAAMVGVHRSTVVRAYDELRALGYLESRAGSYSTVRRRVRPPAAANGAPGPTRSVLAPGRVNWAAAASPGARAVHRLSAPSAAPPSICDPAAPPSFCDPAGANPAAGQAPIDFERLAADPSLAPGGEIRRCLRQVLVRQGGAALDYADSAGWTPLREAIARRMCAHGVAVDAAGILVTGGAQQGLDLALRLLTRPGDEVAVEAPTYGMAHALLRLHQVRPLEVPMRATGMDLEVLAHLLRTRQPRLLYTMPNFHNPTGVTTGQPHRERLLAMCEHYRVPIVEDGFEEEMKYFGQAVLPVKSMDARGVVIYVGTFSKVVFPGLRIGWIAAPVEAIARLASVQNAACLSGNTLAQAAVARFCGGGGFEQHLRRVHRVYRRRMQAMLSGLDEHLPPAVARTRPDGGYTLWLTLPGKAADEPGICDRIARQGVKVAPGRRFYARPPAEPHLRLSIACVDEETIREGCRRLGRALG